MEGGWRSGRVTLLLVESRRDTWITEGVVRSASDASQQKKESYIEEASVERERG